MTPEKLARIATKHPFWRLADSAGGADACWPWQGYVDRDGYGRLDGVACHRIAHELYRGAMLQPGDVVRHSCDNPRCCNPRHLIAGTQQANVDDRVQRQRGARGEKNGRAVLSADQVRSIYADTASYSTIARRFGVEKTTVGDIKSGRNWAWLTGADIPERSRNIPLSKADRRKAGPTC